MVASLLLFASPLNNRKTTLNATEKALHFFLGHLQPLDVSLTVLVYQILSLKLKLY